MRYPSVKTLVGQLGVSESRAKYIRKLMRLEVSDHQLPAATQRWLRQCYHTTSIETGRMATRREVAMHAIDVVLGTHGVEAVELSANRKWIDSYHCNIAFTYCNTGDTYMATVLLDSASQHFAVSSWGGRVEGDTSRYR